MAHLFEVAGILPDLASMFGLSVTSSNIEFQHFPKIQNRFEDFFSKFGDHNIWVYHEGASCR